MTTDQTLNETALSDPPHAPEALDQRLSPTAAKERYEILDVLRGLALFGILMANMRGFNAPEAVYFRIGALFNGPLDHFVQNVVNAVFVGKFISLFSFMFGLGFAVQFTRGTEKGRAFAGWFAQYPRLAYLLALTLIIGIPAASQMIYAQEMLTPVAAKIGIAALGTIFLWALLMLRLRDLRGHEQDFVGFFTKRLILLYGIGWLHVSLIWWGDVLTQYACAGLLLLLFRKSSLKVLMVWTWIIALLQPVATLGYAIYLFIAHKAPDVPPDETKILAEITDNLRLYATGSPWALITDRVHLVWSEMPMIVVGVAISLLPCFLFGLYVWKKGIVRDIDAHLPLIQKVWMWTLVIATFYWVFGYILPEFIPRANPPKLTIAGSFRAFARSLTPFVALFYLCSFVLVTRTRAVYNFFQPCAAIGRTCLSNYLLQSLLGLLLFTSVGLGWYGKGIVLFGKVGPAWDFVISIAIYLLQIPLSQWYLRHFRIGPVEWLWRTLAYGEAPQFRRRADQITGAEPATV